MEPHPPSGRVREVRAKAITRVPGTVDSWFLARYGMNLYRGCAHGCAYCDGRAERYRVEGDFARDIAVKANALEVLATELDRVREPGFVFLGGGVCDAYQPVEARYRLARGALVLARERRLPVHVLTKSALVRRDLDLLEDIGRDTRAVLSFSIQTTDEEVRRAYEPGAAPVAARWALLEEAKARGLGTGVAAMPVLPGISDSASAIDGLVGRAADAGVDFVLFGGLTLRAGTQRDHYLAVLAGRDPELMEGYRRLYRVDRQSGAGEGAYYRRVEGRFADALCRRGLPGRMPHGLFRGLMPLYAELGVLLEHREAAARLAGAPAEGLARTGRAIQVWARRRLAREGRRRGFSYRVVERDLIDLALSGDLAGVPGVDRRAVPVAAAILRGLPRPPEAGQLDLFPG